METKNTAELVETVAACTKALKDAQAETAAARRIETAALNDLNEAQRNLDAHLASIRKDAPRDSDWYRSVYPATGRAA